MPEIPEVHFMLGEQGWTQDPEDYLWEINVEWWHEWWRDHDFNARTATSGPSPHET